jgi:hypothetical protein
MKHLLLNSFLLAGLANQVLAQSITLGPAVAYGSGGSGTSAVAVQDLNGDGKLDIVLANTSSTVGVLLNAGTGTFPATATTYASGATSGNASAVALGDVNADGKADIVVLNTNDSTVGVLLGSGTGTFLAATTYAVGSYSYPTGLALADVNSDGRVDVLVANNTTSSVGVLLSRSTGGLGTVAQLSTGSRNPQSLTAGDMNGDGKPDIIFGSSAGEVVVLLNSGTGTFTTTAAAYPSGGSSVQRVKVGDVNKDGKLDVVTANTFENSVSVLLGTGTGTLGTAASYSAGSNSGLTSVALGDLNKDGRLDLVSANYSINSAGVLLGQSAGGFPATATLFSTGNNSAPNDVVVADVNNDTRPDLITANSTTAKVAVLLNSTVLAAKSALTAASVVLSPNPTRDTALLTIPAANQARTVQVFDAVGREVRRQVLPAHTTAVAVEVAGLPLGAYTVRCEEATGRLIRE